MLEARMIGKLTTGGYSAAFLFLVGESKHPGVRAHDNSRRPRCAASVPPSSSRNASCTTVAGVTNGLISLIEQNGWSLRRSAPSNKGSGWAADVAGRVSYPLPGGASQTSSFGVEDWLSSLMKDCLVCALVAAQRPGGN